MKKILNILTNKYLFDQRDYFQLKERQLELRKLETKKQYYVQEIEKTKQELHDLQNNPAALEKFAREHYLMKKDGEDIYLIEDSSAFKK
jgi:cell division protein DivIC